MKISKSKQELARIISENGGWFEGAEWAAQCKSDVTVSFYSGCAPYRNGDCWCGDHLDGTEIRIIKLMPNWHQTILSSEEYFHLYPAPDADGWIEWKGGECPVKTGELVDIRYRDGEELFGAVANEGESDAGAAFWSCDDFQCDIIAYRLHKPEQAGATDKLSSEAVSDAKIALMSDSIEGLVRKPAIEQLASDYRNAKGYAERKQQEADDAKADENAILKALELAGEAIGLKVSPIAAKQEPELVIADWRDLRVGDEVEYVEGSQSWSIGMVGVVQRTDDDDGGDMNVRLLFGEKGSGWPREWRFIRRP